MISEDRLREILRIRCGQSSQTQVANALGFSVSYIHDVLEGQSISGNFALAMGYKMQKTVVKTFYPTEKAATQS